MASVRVRVNEDAQIPDIIDVTSFRKLLQTGGEILRTNVKKEGQPHAKPTPTVIYGAQVKEFNTDILSPTRAFFIPGQVPSSKNHKRILKKRLSPTEQCKANASAKRIRGTNRAYGTGSPQRVYKYFIGNTETVNRYKKDTARYYREFAEEFRQVSAGMSPIYVEFFFVRKTRATNFDFSNVIQIVQDLMKDYGWIEDDNVTVMLPVPPMTGPAYCYDIHNYGVRITVLKIRNSIN